MGLRFTKDRLIEVDEFIAKLWQVHLKVKEEGYVQVPLRIREVKIVLNSGRTLLWVFSDPIIWFIKVTMIPHQ
jgi:hypothetical protein